MKEKLTVEDFKAMLQLALKNIKARAEEFSRLDAVTGDGDHGEAISTAMEVVVKASAAATDFKTMLNDMGMNVLMEVSGSTSSLLGAFFLGMSDQVSGTELDPEGIRKMFVGGLEGVSKQTKARKGDKTMMDALIPAVEAIASCTSSDVKTLLEAGAQAACKGAEATVAMKANFGRARNYGEQSIGSADCGASSWSCMFSSFAQAL